MSGLVKSIDPQHLLSLGTIGGGQCGTSGPQYKDVHALPDIDLCEYHDYTPNQAVPGDQWNGLGLRIRQCAELGKPLFVGETGIRPIDAGGTLEDRARALQTKVELQLGRGVDGVVAWNWSPLGSTLDDYDIGPGDPALAALQEGGRLSYVVNTTDDDADDGFCTESHCNLREAINWSNTNGFTNSDIRFDIAGPAPHVIKPTTPLPVDHHGRPHRRDVAARLHVGGADDRPQRGRWPGDRRAHGRRGPLGDPRPRDQRLRRGGHPVGRG